MKLPIIKFMKRKWLGRYIGFSLLIWIFVWDRKTLTWETEARRAEMIKETINHEKIHYEQWKELLFIFFPLFYGINFLINFFRYGADVQKAYRNIIFEREAYANEKNYDYIRNRERYSWLKYWNS